MGFSFTKSECSEILCKLMQTVQFNQFTYIQFQPFLDTVSFNKKIFNTLITAILLDFSVCFCPCYYQFVCMARKIY